MSTKRSAYTFDGTPLEPVDPGTNLLVAGPILEGTREVALRLLTADDDDGMVIVSADNTAGETLSACESLGTTVSGDRVRVVDASQDSADGLGELASSVPSPADLTGIGIEYSNHYEQVYAQGYDGVRSGIYTLTPLLVYSDDVRPVFRFVNTVAGRVRTANGIGVCVLDPDAHDERVVNSIAQPFDGRIDVRDAGDTVKLRTVGLDDQPTDWTDL